MYLESNMFNPLNFTKMEEKEIKELIAKKELEINQLRELKPVIGEEQVKQQIDIRLEDLSKLFKLLKK